MNKNHDRARSLPALQDKQVAPQPLGEQDHLPEDALYRQFKGTKLLGLFARSRR